jgi:hypothetical protein
MTDKITVTPQMVREAYANQAGSGNRITNVTADYIAKGLTAALNPPKWTPYKAPYADAMGVEDKAASVRLRVYLAALDGVGRSVNVRPEKAQELADLLNQAEFDV